MDKYSVNEHDLKVPWLFEHFHFRNNEVDDMLVFQSTHMRIELVSYAVCKHFHWFMLHILHTESRPVKSNYAFPSAKRSIGFG